MYQWQHATTGTIQLSGTPPPWYRSEVPGPRVFVFENGQLVDDTGIAITADHRRVLRQRAFSETDGAATEQASPEAVLMDALEAANADGIDVNAATSDFTAKKKAEESLESENSVAQTVTELKALIEAWDEQRVREAKEILRETDISSP